MGDSYGWGALVEGNNVNCRIPSILRHHRMNNSSDIHRESSREMSMNRKWVPALAISTGLVNSDGGAVAAELWQIDGKKVSEETLP